MTANDERATASLESALGAIPPAETATATVGLGCFWGPEARFGALEGVVRTRVGYAGGTSAAPSYYALGDHTEVVQLEYDPNELRYEELLEVAWESHDWTSRAPKRQYRGVILAHDERQFDAATHQRAALEDRTGRSVATDIERFESFTLAEAYHQKYELRSTPVLGDELADRYGDAFVDSTLVTRLNGFVAGHGTDRQRNELLAVLELPPAMIDEIRRRC